MVLVDMKIAGGVNTQIKQAVMGDMVEHVVIKTDAGMDVNLTGAVKVQQDYNIRFFCDTMNLTRSTTHV